MKNIYDFFYNWKLEKIIFWYRIFAYSFIILQSFKIKGFYNQRLAYSAESAPQATQVASETIMHIVHSFSNVIIVVLVLIALEVQWAGKRRDD
jgi:hypothetical protein